VYFQDICQYISQSEEPVIINFCALKKLIKKELPTVTRMLNTQVLTRNPVAQNLTLPKYLKLETNPIAWSKKDRIMRNMSNLEKKSRAGIVRPLGFYRLNTKMDLEMGSSDSRDILKALVQSPDAILKTPLRVVAHIKHNQWKMYAQIYGVTHIFFAGATGYAITNLESHGSISLLIYIACAIYLLMTFFELVGSGFSKRSIWKCLFNLLCTVSALLATSNADNETPTFNWFRAVAIAFITLNGIGKLDNISYMRYTIEVVREVVVD
jgi:hypothetical protein